MWRRQVVIEHDGRLRFFWEKEGNRYIAAGVPYPPQYSEEVSEASLEDLFEALGVDLSVVAPSAQRRVPSWMRRAATLAVEISRSQTNRPSYAILHDISRPARAPHLAIDGFSWMRYEHRGSSSLMISISEPMPTLRGPLQRGWPLKAPQFISLLAFEYPNVSKAKAIRMLAEAVGVPSGPLLRSAGYGKPSGKRA